MCSINFMKLGTRLKKARVAAGLTQAALAELCGWESPSRIGNYEQGTREPTLADLKLIAKHVHASGYDFAWLVLGDEASRPHSEAQPRMEQSPSAESGTEQQLKIDAKMLAEAISALRRLASRYGWKYDPETHAPVTAYAYELLGQLPEAPATADVIDFGAKLAQRMSVQAEVSGGSTGGSTQGRETHGPH